MVEINFYHLTRSSLDGALMTLLEKAYAGGNRALVRVGDEAQVSDLDTMLWVKKPEEFLPHGTAGSKFPSDQPIFLTAGDDNTNKAEFAFILPEGSVKNLDFFDRVFFLFEGGSDPQVQEAREHWKMLKKEGFDMKYWTQDEKGRWSQKNL